MNVSVCMATYNGENFIHEQLTSILEQLGEGDEIVIVDDASDDRTIAISEGFRDFRIRIFRNASNSGVIRTFSRALEESRGDIICLADQDDVWRGDKLSSVKSVFMMSPDVSLVVSDCQIIDSVGEIVATTRFSSRRFRSGAFHNIIRNQYLGCTMAFRRDVLKYCLPIPSDVPMHDMWIGIVNEFVGKPAFIDESLISYRRHDKNVSPHNRHAPLLQMVRWRWALVKNLLLLYVRTVIHQKLAGTLFATKK